MSQDIIIVSKLLDAPKERVWKALTDRDEMKGWYFDLKAFKPEVGFEFEFYGGTPEKQYLHLCKIVEVVPGEKLAYSWRYDGYEGNSIVTFELSEEGDKTKVTLTHTGVSSFPKDDPNFAVTSFTAGWTYIIETSLPQYLSSHN